MYPFTYLNVTRLIENNLKPYKRHSYILFQKERKYEPSPKIYYLLSQGLSVHFLIKLCAPSLSLLHKANIYPSLFFKIALPNMCMFNQYAPVIWFYQDCGDPENGENVAKDLFVPWFSLKVRGQTSSALREASLCVICCQK